jgi:hypothetical protein
MMKKRKRERVRVYIVENLGFKLAILDYYLPVKLERLAHRMQASTAIDAYAFSFRVHPFPANQPFVKTASRL